MRIVEVNHLSNNYCYYCILLIDNYHCIDLGEIL